MIDKIISTISDVSLSKTNGRFLSDKSYGFDTVFFMSKFIKHNAINLQFNSRNLREKAIKYIEDIFQLSKGTAGAVNYFLETLNLLEFSNIIKKTDNKTYFIKENSILSYIAERPENAYIFVYLVTYQTFTNDRIMPLYERYCLSKDLDEKAMIVKDVHKLFCDKSVSIEDGGKSNWSKQLVKYSFIVLGYINQQNIIARTLNVKPSKVTVEDISLNVAGTRTPIYLPKKNDYLQTFNNNYITFYLKPYMIRNVGVIDLSKISMVDSLATNLADLKLTMQDDVVNGNVLTDMEKQQYIANVVRTRNQAVQRQFRKALLANNEHRCPICGFCFEEFLIASHIKPYAQCEDTYDAINHFNGLLMCPNHDKLFEDAKHMTIDYQSGQIILSGTAEISKDFGHIKGKSIPKIYVSNERRHYLKWHNERFIEHNK